MSRLGIGTGGGASLLSLNRLDENAAAMVRRPDKLGVRLEAEL